MVKEFFKKIIVEVIKELISPSLIVLEKKIENLRDEMRSEIKEIKEDIRHLDRRLDDLYKVVVRREEHYSLEEDVKMIRSDVELLKRRVGI